MNVVVDGSTQTHTVDAELEGILRRAQERFRARDAIGAAAELEAVHALVSHRGARAADPHHLESLLADCVAEALSVERYLRDELARVNTAASARRAYSP